LFTFGLVAALGTRRIRRDLVTHRVQRFLFAVLWMDLIFDAQVSWIGIPTATADPCWHFHRWLYAGGHRIRDR